MYLLIMSYLSVPVTHKTANRAIQLYVVESCNKQNKTTQRGNFAKNTWRPCRVKGRTIPI